MEFPGRLFRYHPHCPLSCPVCLGNKTQQLSGGRFFEQPALPHHPCCLSWVHEDGLTSWEQVLSGPQVPEAPSDLEESSLFAFPSSFLLGELEEEEFEMCIFFFLLTI